jgi:hypothetical protein
VTHRRLKHLSTLLALTASLCVALPAMAQSKKELAAKVVQLQQPAVDNIARGIASQTAQQVLQSAGQALQGVAPDKREAVGKDIQADVKKFYDELEPVLRDRATKLAPATLGPLLEEKFSEEELKQVIAWLDSTAAKKYQQLGPDLQTAMAQKVVTETRATVEPKLKSLEASIQKRLGQTPATSAPAASGSKAGTPAKK